MFVKCPNKNTKEWRALVEKLGEDSAWRVFITLDDLPSLSEIENINSSEELAPIVDQLKVLLSDQLSEEFNIEQFNELVYSITSTLLNYQTEDRLSKIEKNPEDYYSEIKEEYEESRDDYTREGREGEANLFTAILNNWDKIKNASKNQLVYLGKAKGESSVNINKEQGDGFEDIEFSFEKIWFTEDAVWGNDNKFNSSTRLREFLFLTRAKSYNYENSEFNDVFNTFNTFYKIVPIDVVFNTLKQILSDTEPDFNLMKIKLEEASTSIPWIRDVIDKLEGKEDYNILKELDLNQIKQEFVTIMTNSTYNFKTFLFSSENPNESKVIDSIRYSTEKLTQEVWRDNLINSDLMELTEEGYKLKESERLELIKWYDENIRENDLFKPNERDLVYFTGKLGINLSPLLISKLLKEKVGNQFPLVQWKTKTNTTKIGIFNLLYQRLKSSSDQNDKSLNSFERNNPLYNNSAVKLLAKEQSYLNDVLQSNSFTNGQGNIINTVNQQRGISIRHNFLKNNPTYIKEVLLKIPFLKDDTNESWLSRFAKSDQDFLNNFSISFLDTLREEGRGLKGSKPTEFNNRQLISSKLIGYHNQNRKNAEFLWTVPGKGSLVITAPKVKVKTVDGELATESLNKLYEIVKAELRRNDAQKISLNSYDNSQLYFFPKMNEVEVKKSIEAEKELKKILQLEFKKANENKLKELKDNKFIDSNGNLTIIPVENIEKFIEDYNFNYMLTNFNMYQSFIGDPALFSKKDTKSTWDNISKRLVKDLASGLRVPKTNEKYSHLQLALKTEKKASKNINQIRERFSELNDYITNFSNIDITDAAEYVTYKERLNNHLALGLISDSDYSEIITNINKRKRGEKTLPLDFLLKKLGKKGLFGPAKPVQTGRRVVYDSENNPVAEAVDYVKSAEVVLLEEYTKGYPELDALRIKMENLEKNKTLNPKGLTVRASYDSANKLGGAIPMNKSEEISDVNFIESSKEGLRYQTEIPYDDKKYKIVNGTQPRKNLETLLNDFKTFILDGKEVKGSDLKTKYRKLYKDVFKNNQDEFNEEFTIDGVLDESKISEVLQKEAIKSGWTEQEIKAIQFKNGYFRFPPFLQANDKFQSLVLSFVNNRILKNKRRGRSYTAMSEEGFSGYAKDAVYTKNYTGELLPNRIDPETNKILPAQILISQYFKDKKTGKNINLESFIIEDENGIKRLELPEEFFQTFGYRIPNSGYNLMSNFEVVGFLPDYLADTVIAPRDVVAQMGMDYDADKLFIYLPETEVIDNKLEIADSLDNDLLKIERAILENTDIYKYLLEPINSNRISKYLKIYDKENNSNYLNESFYSERYVESVDAASLIGSFATTVTLISQISNQEDLYFTTGDSKFIISFSDLAGQELGSTKVSGLDRIKFQVISQFLSMALDNDKEPMAGKLNINSSTSGIINTMILSGFDEDIIIPFLNHPVIKEYINEKKYLFEDSKGEIELTSSLQSALNILGNQISEKVELASTTDLKAENNEDYNSPENRERVLSLFLKIEERSKDISKIKSALSVDSSYLDKTMFDNYLKEQQIQELATVNVNNASKLLGDYIGDSLEIPTSIPGFAAYYGLKYNNELWSKHFPYSSSFIDQTLIEITRINKVSLNADQKKSIVKSIKEYFYSYATQNLIKAENKESKIKTLSKSLPIELLKVKNKNPNNVFLNLIRFDNKDNLSVLMFNNSSQEGMDEKYIHNAFIELLTETEPEFTTKLIDYILLTQPLSSPTNIVKFIPIEYYEVTGLTERLNTATYNLTKNELDRNYSNFYKQLLQHNPNLAKRFNLNDAEGKIFEGNDLIAFSITEEDESFKGVVQYKSYYDNKNKKWKLYELKNTNKYERIGLLGSKSLTEMDMFDKDKQSIIENNNFVSKSEKGQPSIKPQKEVNRKLPNKTSSTIKYIDKYNIVEDFNGALDSISQNYPKLKILVDLIKDSNTDFKIKIDNSIRSRAIRKGNTLIFNMEEISKDSEGLFVQDILEEAVHVITGKTVEKDFNSLTKEEKTFVSAIDGLRKRTIDDFMSDSILKVEYETFLEKRKKREPLTNKERNLFYPTENNQEFIAGVFLKKTFQEHLNNKPFTESKSRIERLIEVIRDLFKSFKNTFNIKDNSELEEALKVSLSIIKNETSNANKNLKLLNSNELFESNPELANEVYSIMGLTIINESDITYTDEEGNPCAKNGLTNTTKGTSWKIVKDFKGQPKHSQGGVDISISNKGVSMRRGGKDIKAAYGLVIPNNN